MPHSNPIIAPPDVSHIKRYADMVRPPSESTMRHVSSALEKAGFEKSPSHSDRLSQSLRGMSNPYADTDSQIDTIFELFKIPNKNQASIGKLLTVMKSFGVRENDLRLKPMMDKVCVLEQAAEELSNEAKDPRHWKLVREEFLECVSGSVDIVTKVLQNDLIIPAWSGFVENMRDIYNQCREIIDGEVATYIPQLARQDPKLFGVSICTVDGQRASFGDSSSPFCVQSVSKAFNYAIAASDLGADMVHSYVGQEPSGRLFNDISLDHNDKPHNPMVNSGAIVVTSLIKNKLHMADRFDYVLTQYRRISGGEYVGFNNATFLSERATADRNYALSYYMKEKNCFPPEVGSLTNALDFYFQLCSLETTCESLSVMAATLANGGVCPLTGEKCIEPGPCRDVLSLMYSCGMYDASGQFSFSVGLPAKSGVSGIMIVVVPNVMGLAMFSPRLDKMGNSCRGVAFCKKLVNRFNFHNYDCLLHTESNKIDPRRREQRERDRLVPALFAARANDLTAVRRLYLQGADLSVADYDGRCPLHVAACEGNLSMCTFLVNIARVPVDVRDRWGRTPLDDAHSFQHTHVEAFLDKAVNAQAPHLMTPSHSAGSDSESDGSSSSGPCIEITPPSRRHSSPAQDDNT